MPNARGACWPSASASGMSMAPVNAPAAPTVQFAIPRRTPLGACGGRRRGPGPRQCTYGDTTISIGGGAQFLKLPDVRFTFLSSERDGMALTKQKNSILDDYGGAASGSIETPLGFWDGRECG